MKRLITAALGVLMAVSCGKNGTDGLYISVADTCWEISNETQVAWPCYIGRDVCTIIQYDETTGVFQTMNGSYTVDGSHVYVSAESAVTMIRTFSHLKNSKHKNYTRLKAEAPQSVGGSVWGSLKANDFRFDYLRQDGTSVTGSYANVIHQEGIPSGWSWTTGAYSVNGNQYTAEEAKGTFYGNKFVVLETMAEPCLSTISNSEGTSSLKGTVWTYVNSGYPGVIIFTSATEFTRLLVASSTMFSVLKGTYSLKGNSLEFKTDSEELHETCTVSNGRFTYLQRTYSLVSSF